MKFEGTIEELRALLQLPGILEEPCGLEMTPESEKQAREYLATQGIFPVNTPVVNDKLTTEKKEPYEYTPEGELKKSLDIQRSNGVISDEEYHDKITEIVLAKRSLDSKSHKKKEPHIPGYTYIGVPAWDDGSFIMTKGSMIIEWCEYPNIINGGNVNWEIIKNEDITYYLFKKDET